jgi:CheY-like chemotaxis protein
MKVGERTSADLARSPRKTDKLPGPARTLSILVVDDDRDSADGIAMLLSHWNHNVRVAYEGRRAIEIFRTQRPDLVLLDIGLPGMNGYELATRLRSERHRAFLAALTGYTDRRRAIAAGFEEHFPKPVDPDALRDLISSL